MTSLEALPAPTIRAVFSDLDETITDNGCISAETYTALCRLKESGLKAVIVTGRPAGWADCLIRVWPLDAVIYETGAGLYSRRDGVVDDVVLVEGDAEARRARLQGIFEKLKRKIPHLRLAHDQPYRRFDFAIDYAEDPPFLSPAELELVMEELRKEKDITSQFSTAHVNYWCGEHTKATACRYWLDTEGKRLGIEKSQCVFAGDSLNDEPLFALFEHSVGVANISRYLDALKTKPRYLTVRRGGSGFQELVDRLINH